MFYDDTGNRYAKRKQEICVDEEIKIAVGIAIDRFIKSERQQELFFPSSFSSIERSYVHKICAELKLKSKSRGKGAGRYVTVRKQDSCFLGPASLSLLRSSKHQAITLLQKYAVTSRELQELQPRNERFFEDNVFSGIQDTFKQTGCLSDGIAQVPPRRSPSEFDRHWSSLPTMTMHNIITRTILENQVTMVTGQPGCGKSTQVAQYLLDQSLATNQPCRIFCTQPRRLYALTLAERVAAERGERVGQTIGYQIRLESRVSPKTLLTFCTNSVLLRTLATNDISMAMVTHVIVDEVQERDRFADFLLTCLRDLLPVRQNMKVVIIDNGDNTEKFVKYFNGCPVVQIPTTPREVSEVFLEDLLRRTNYVASHIRSLEAETTRLAHQQSILAEWCGGNISSREETVPRFASAPPIDMDDGTLQVMDKLLEEVWIKGNQEVLAQIVRVILNDRASVNYRHYNSGITPLMAAAYHGLLDGVIFLIDLDADVWIPAPNGYLAVDWAETRNQTEVVKYLVQRRKPKAHMTYATVEDEYILSVYNKLPFSDNAVDLDLTVATLHYIVSTFSYNCSILVFLPSYDEVVFLRDRLLFDDKLFCNSASFQIHSVHANMLLIPGQSCDEKKLYLPQQSGVTKIVLTTSLCESSITVPNVTHVVDTGKVKMMWYTMERESSFAEYSAISDVSRIRRAYRATVECFHLFPKGLSLVNSHAPEMLRYPLHELGLHCKLLCSPNTPISEFLLRTPSPPGCLAIMNSVSFLKDIDAMDTSDELTDLGHHLADLPVEPHLGKMVLYSIVLKCLDPVLTIACAVAHRDTFVVPSSPGRRALALNAKKRFAADTFSDHMALLRAFQGWQRARNDGNERQFCDRNFVSTATMEMIVGMRAQLLGHLRAAGFVRARGAGDIRDLNTNSENWAVVKAAILSGIYPNLVRVDRELKRLVSQHEGSVQLHHSNVIYHPAGRQVNLAELLGSSVDKLPTDWSIYEAPFRHLGSTYLQCCTVVTALTVALIAGPAKLSVRDSLVFPGGCLGLDSQGLCLDGVVDTLSDSEFEDSADDNRTLFKLDDWITFKIDPENAALLFQVRQKWHSLFLRRMKAPTRSTTDNDESVVKATVQMLSQEEQALGLVQPSGIGQRPRPMSVDDSVFHSTEFDPNVSCELTAADYLNSPSVLYHLRQDSQPVVNNPVLMEKKTSLSRFVEDDRLYSKEASPVSSAPMSPNSKLLSGPSVRYFLMKCTAPKDIEDSIHTGQWTTVLQNERRLNRAYCQTYAVYLIVAVEGTGRFYGFCRMTSGATKDQLNQEAIFCVDWGQRSLVSFQQTQHLRNPWNDNRPVHAGRDGTELETSVGEALCKMWGKFVPITPAIHQDKLEQQAGLLSDYNDNEMAEWGCNEDRFADEIAALNICQQGMFYSGSYQQGQHLNTLLNLHSQQQMWNSKKFQGGYQNMFSK